jgi:hypothetical protein
MARLHAGPCWGENGQAPGRRDARHAVEEDLKTEFFAAPPNGKIEHLKELVDDPYVLFGVSDGGAHTKFLTAGRYPTETICKVVREHKMLSLEDVHWRLSTLPAEVAGFRGRGQLRKGTPADIVIYDFDGLRVLPTRSFTTCQAASGVAYSARQATSISWSTAKSRCAVVSRPIRIPAACFGTEAAEQAVLSKPSNFLTLCVPNVWAPVAKWFRR